MILIIVTMILVANYNKYISIQNNKTFFGEDLYHSKHFKSGISYINSSLKLSIDRDKSDKLIPILVKRMIKFTLKYFTKYPHIYVKINKYNLCEENKYENIYDNLKIRYKILPLKIFYSYKHQEILVIMDHLYIGGFFFQEFGRNILGGEKTNPYELKYIPILSELSILYLAKDAVPLYFRNTRIPLVKDSNNIKRVGIKINIETLQKKYNSKSKPCIIHRLVQILFKYLKIDSNLPLIIMIPVGFENSKLVHNNVGVIILDIYKSDTHNDILRKLKNKKYQATSTNYLQYIVNNTGDVRQFIDCVFSIGFIKNPKINSKEVTISVSFTDTCDYPVYCSSISVGNIANISLTICTNLFNTEKFLMEEKDSYIIF